jgi:hypothetical protein
MLFQEAIVVLNLHAQVVTKQSIRSLVPTVLELGTGTFTRWHEQIMLILGKYSLQDHVLRDLPISDSHDWARMDCVVRSWLYGKSAGDLLDFDMRRGDCVITARATWLAIES